MIAPGARLGPYEIVSPLAAGGMGVVYRARDTRLGRDVAVKLLPEQVAGDAAVLARFEQEARILATLSHPNLLTIYDVGNVDGKAFVITELLQGATLRERLATAEISCARAIEWALQVAKDSPRQRAVGFGASRRGDRRASHGCRDHRRPV